MREGKTEWDCARGGGGGGGGMRESEGQGVRGRVRVVKLDTNAVYIPTRTA